MRVWTISVVQNHGLVCSEAASGRQGWPSRQGALGGFPISMLETLGHRKATPTLLWNHNSGGLQFFSFLSLFLDRGGGREKERERSINVWWPLTCPLLGSWPATQACALIGNQIGDPLAFRPALNPLSLTSQCCSSFCWTWCAKMDLEAFL